MIPCSYLIIGTGINVPIVLADKQDHQLLLGTVLSAVP
jgi:hypothetical protein